MDNSEIKKYIDLDGGLARVGGNAKLYSRLLGMFLKSKEIDVFEEAIAENDIPKAADAAHAIKGVSGNLSLTVLFETSMQLMNQLRNGQKDDALIEIYREAVLKTREAVEAFIEQSSN